MEDKEMNIKDNALSGSFNQDNLLTLEKVTRCFMNMPSSEVTNLALNVMTAGKEQLGELPERKAATTHNGSELTIDRQGGARTITLSHQDEHFVSIRIDEVEKLIGNNKGTKKLFAFILYKLGEQALNGNKEITRTNITFPLKELSAFGLYKNTKTARVGAIDALEIITKLRVSARLYVNKKKKIEQASAISPFYGYNISSGQVSVYLAPEFNWEAIATYYTILPSYAFRLKIKAFDLIYYIFYLARQNIRKIEKDGYFNISMRAIHSRLMLPNIEGNKDPGRTIREPIEKAVEEIEEAAQNSDFTITPHYNEGEGIKSYLDNGYIRIGLKGEYAKDFITLSKKKAKEIETKKKKNEAIRDKARAAALQKVIEAESKQA